MRRSLRILTRCTAMALLVPSMQCTPPEPLPELDTAAPAVTVNAWPDLIEVRSTPTRIEPRQATRLSIVDGGEALSYQWSDAGGGCTGRFDDASLASPTWTAPPIFPADNMCTLTVEIIDTQGGIRHGTAVVFVGVPDFVDLPPVITAVRQTRLVGAAGESVGFEVVAVDPEGGPLDFTWSTGVGRFTRQDDTDTRSAVAFETPFLCGGLVLLTAMVTDMLGTATAHAFLMAVDMPIEEIDVPDAAGIDADCDGIDGDTEVAFFVRPGGNDAGPGTLDQPFATIQHALDQAEDDPVRWQVLVAEGVYAESLVLPDGVGLFGQYDATWQRDGGNDTIVDAPAITGVLAVDISSETFLEGLEIRTADAPPGQSTMAVALQDVTGPLYVRHNRLVAGSGGSGAPGSAGLAGGNGMPGGNGGLFSNGAGGQAASTCGGAGGNGGGPGGAGSRGGSDGGTGGTGGTSLGAFGLPGAPGSVGSAGAVPANQAAGTLTGLSWRAGSGVAGGKGRCGGGGGGGHSNICALLPMGGGGGGGGGEGGSGGTPGTGGGGAFGVFAVNAGAAIVVDNVIETGSGGSGGDGGSGGNGGNGGSAGLGGSCLGRPPGGLGAGGNGGSGGSGGKGGGASGGAGGMSVGIYRSRSDTLSTSSNVFLLGPAGLGGRGGSGGSGVASSGATGIRAGEHDAD